MSETREPCSNCGSTEPMYQVGDQALLRCPGCFMTVPVAEGKAGKVRETRVMTISAPEPPEGKADGKAAGGRKK